MYMYMCNYPLETNIRMEIRPSLIGKIATFTTYGLHTGHCQSLHEMTRGCSQRFDT